MRGRHCLRMAVVLTGPVGLWLLWSASDRRAPSEASVSDSGHAAAPGAKTQPPPIPQSRNAPAASPAVSAATTLQGRVVNASGEPAQGVWVAAYQPETGAAHTLTDASGHFVFSALADGSFRGGA